MRARSPGLLLVLGLLAVGAFWAALYLPKRSEPAFAEQAGSADAVRNPPAPELQSEDAPSAPGERTPATARTSSEARAPNAASPAHAQVRKSALRGRVVDDSEHPITDFEVELVHRGWFQAHERRVEHFQSNEGRFALEDLGPGAWELSVHALCRAQAQGAQSVQLPHDDELEIRMRAMASVAGVVLDPSGAPLEDASVRAHPAEQVSGAEDENPNARTRTDAQGRFHFAALPPTRLLISVHAHGCSACDSQTLTLAPLECVEGIVLRLRSGGTIQGEITAPFRSAFADRTVSFLCAGSKTDVEARIQADGSFVLEHAPPGLWQIYVKRERSGAGDSLPRQLSAACEVSEGRTTRVVLGAPRLHPVRVAGIVSRRGQPVPNYHVMALRDAVPALAGASFAQTDALGRYELTLEGSGPTVFVYSQREGALDGLELRRDVPKGANYALDAWLPSGAVQGRVLDADAQPLKGEYVWALPNAASLSWLEADSLVHEQTDAEGAFELQGLAPGTYRIVAGGGPSLDGYASSHGRESRRVVIAKDERLEQRDFRLGPPLGVRGRVRDAADRPLAGMAIYARAESGELLQPLALATSDSSGEFACGGLPPGSYTLFARGREMATRESAPVRAADAFTWAKSERCELRAEPASVLRVSLLHADGTGADAAVALLDERGRDVGDTLLPADFAEMLDKGTLMHRARFGPLPSGTYTVQVQPFGGRSISQKVALAGELEKNVTVRVD